MNEQKKYNIGLDIGTTSVGWAVVEADTQKIIRKGKGNNRKALWGVRLFEEAETAANRRSFRSTRRRYERRRKRIKLLQDEFKEEINKVDSTFFKKLQESKYHENDAINKSIILTSAEKEKIKEYNEQYKTIYHLRKKLIENPEKEDIRLVYLAIHHIIKYRGNFLYPGENFNSNNLNIDELLKELMEATINYVPTLNIPENYSDIISSKEFETAVMKPSKNDVKESIKKLFSNLTDNKNYGTELGKLLVGNKFNIKKFFLMDDLEKDISISFSGTDYDEKYDELSTILGEKIEIIDILKKIYDTIFLKKLFKDNENVSISCLRVKKYKEHEKDLKFLKELLKDNRTQYNKVFRSKKELCLYEKYTHNKKSYEDFIKDLGKIVEETFSAETNNELAQKWLIEILPKIDRGEFLPRITETDNGRYPYQLNSNELKVILENQGKYYPFLLERINNKYKIEKILEFKIPYYVGPLNNTTSNKNKTNEHAWMERKIDNVKITPYNFDEVVDKEKTAEKFIKRMISHCTYLLNEYALPNNSILYSRFKVMNELKQIKVNGIKLTQEQQLDILNNLFMKTSGTITDKKFKFYLKSSKEFDMYEGNINVTGYSADEKFANNMQPYIDFFGNNGIFENTTYTEENADEIIEWITIFDDKDILEKKIRNSYIELNDNQIKKILSKNYSGWGKLSKKLLTELTVHDKRTGTPQNILNLMYETEENFMQIINNEEYNFQELIKENNTNTDIRKVNYQLVENLATSPATKKGIYQALKVTEEIINYMGYVPNNIMVEMARGEDKVKARKDDRKKQLLKLYKNIKKEQHNYRVENLNQITNELNSKEKVDSQRLFLYFIQEGKCLYTGTPLDINNLSSYEIDHILPQSLIKDDSIDNKALVLRRCNQIKKDSFTLPREYRSTYMKNWWTHLKKVGLISASKFYRLTRDKYSDEDIQGFINRQLVETRQITKHVANILNNLYKDTKVIYLKANLSHNYREKYELFKFREINDYHHAHDAYLAAVLGEYKEKYLKKNINFELIKELNSRLKELGNYKELKYGFAINSLDENVNDIVLNLSKKFFDEETGELLFDVHQFNKRVEDTLYRNDILISRKTEIRTGKFYDETKQTKGQKGVALKKNMPINLYGSYTKLRPSYAIMVKYTKRNKEEQRLMGVPIFICKSKDKDKELKNYFKRILNLSNEDTIIVSKRKIPFYSYLIWNNQKCYLVGASDKVEVVNALQFHYKKEFYQKYKYSLNRLFNKRPSDNLSEEEYNKDLSDIIKYIVDTMEEKYVLFKNLIDELKIIVKYYENFEYSQEEKEKIILQLTLLLNCRSDNANFKFLNSSFSSAFGKKNDRIIESCEIFNKSIAGLKTIQLKIDVED